ncbi:tetratricopeptide repeat protein [Aquimarina sp. D1M17]|uniref:tetratricopeptide repeat protein n=1 Tax=Aquimarina acroporae TaxID=2937283 RepID=UPI0020BE0427|nr:tetratricopeptide repeat protein [Aquimarina acroporae]MCK8521301.1 tetratricopeptide repeat protein [Aquimarina acroporae]
MIFSRVSFYLSEKGVTKHKSIICLIIGSFLALYSVQLWASTQKIDTLLQKLSVHQDNDALKVDMLNNIGFEYWIVDANKSIQYGSQALQLSEQLNYKDGEAKANRVIGVAYWAQGNLNMALQYLNISYKVYEDLDDKTGVANTRLNIGMVYADLKEYEKAKYHYERAINEFTGLGLKGRIATTFTKIGTMLIEQHKDEDAVRYLTDALQMHTDNNFTYGIAEAHNKLGMLYAHKNEIEQAYYHIKKSMELGRQVSDTDGLTNNLILHGKILRLSDRFDEAASELNKGLRLAQENGLKKYELLAYEELKELKKQQGKPEEVYQYYDKYITLRDSLFNLEKSKQVAYLEFENELEKRDKALQSLQVQEKKDRLIQYLLLLGTITMAIAGIFIYVISRQRVQKNRQLIEKDQELLASAYELSQKNLENAQLKEQELKQQLDFQNKELSAYTLNFIKKNEIVQQIQKTIQSIKKAPSVEKNKLITDLNKIVRKNVSIDKDWEDFSRFFEDAHQGFYTKLKSRHPDLSSNDLKICSLIRLNLNVKEMAGILGISPDSARTARYRLRKKMKLAPDQEILSYLIQLEQE